MPLFCKQCNNRRLPRWMTAEKMTLWICETCKNFVDMEDIIIREQTEEERQESKRKLEEFEEYEASKD